MSRDARLRTRQKKRQEPGSLSVTGEAMAAPSARRPRGAPAVGRDSPPPSRQARCPRWTTPRAGPARSAGPSPGCRWRRSRFPSRREIPERGACRAHLRNVSSHARESLNPLSSPERRHQQHHQCVELETPEHHAKGQNDLRHLVESGKVLDGTDLTKARAHVVQRRNDGRRARLEVGPPGRAPWAEPSSSR